MTSSTEKPLDDPGVSTLVRSANSRAFRRECYFSQIIYNARAGAIVAGFETFSCFGFHAERLGPPARLIFRKP